ncbi:MAG: T9SS type A sorting domain-containing protein [Rhizobacter sp.]|nr:T9SS type A sorting domain-containing protein [Chlorobiales bacterium]
MSDLVTGLVDVRFTNKDSGFAVGQGGAYPNTTTVVLFTADGGTTWQTRYTSTKTGIWSWKISFPTRDTGYVSTQGYSDSTTFLKTVDGGLTWKESTFLSRAGSKQFSAEGIGFVTPSLGWIGAYPSSSYLMDSYRTTNGGATWNIDTFGKSLNRFRMFGDTLGYAVGETVYKYTNETLAASTPAKNASPSGYELRQNYPNPFNPATTIAYELPKAAAVSLKVYDVIGREVASLVNERKAAGRYEVRFDGSKLASGIYMYRLIAGDYVEVREMVFLK